MNWKISQKNLSGEKSMDRQEYGKYRREVKTDRRGL